jgi:enoyl-CoA hydratase/carnithine racemase
MFVEIAAPPMNLLGPELVRDLGSFIQQLEADQSIRVVVFRSNDAANFIPHVDVTRIKEYAKRWRTSPAKHHSASCFAG